MDEQFFRFAFDLNLPLGLEYYVEPTILEDVCAFINVCVCGCGCFCAFWLNRLLHHFSLCEPGTLLPLCNYNPFQRPPEL